MSFGYPGDNLHLENHGVSEESFWPSFTDIMMVIVMVFLLVTVVVILNNWTLISDLKESINAQKAASTLAENKQVENLSLEAKLDYLEKQLLLSKEQTKEEKAKVAKTLVEIAQSQKLVGELTTLSNEQKILIEEGEKSLTVAQNSILEKDKQIALITQQRDETSASLENKLLALTLMQNNRDSLKKKFANLQKEQGQLQTSLTDTNKKLETQKKASEEASLKVASLQKELDSANQIVESNKIASNDTKAKLQLLSDERQEQDEALQRLEEEKQRIITALNEKLSASQKELSSLKLKSSDAEAGIAEAQVLVTKIEARVAEVETKLKEAEKRAAEAQAKTTQTETQISDTEKKLAEAESKIAEVENRVTEKDETIASLQQYRNSSETQLLSLQGEYDTLDSKYQKLLRPARSSKGKYIVSVSYQKTGGRKTIRLKRGPNADYKTLNQSEVDKVLKRLKKKYKNDLYVKIIIPENSGLSYNEAWRFTSTLQKKYDYYFQPDSTPKSNKKNLAEEKR